MFDVHCEGHGGRVLLDASDVVGMVNAPDAIYLHWRCWCGHEGTSRTGRRVAAAGAVVDTPRPAPRLRSHAVL